MRKDNMFQNMYKVKKSKMPITKREVGVSVHKFCFFIHIWYWNPFKSVFTMVDITDCVQLELFCAVNMLQFIFLSLRLDGFTTWSWEVVFVPLWIVLCLSLVGVLYTIIFAGILLRTPQVNAKQRRSWFNSALAYTFLVVPILIFQVNITTKIVIN